jgi:hypothetical protein
VLGVVLLVLGRFVNVRVADAGGGLTRVTTETRCAGTDAAASRTFAKYWRAIYPGSAIIRRAWLDAIARLAQEGKGGI